MIPAIFTECKIVTGIHHGDAYSKLTNEEKNSQLLSGAFDCEHNKFISENNEIIYMKEMMLLRHAEADIRQENGPITPCGRIKIFQTAKFLKSLNLNGYYGFCSPYLRCQQTAAIISEICSVPFKIIDNLKKNTTQIIEALDEIPEKAILITHTDFIQKVLLLLKEKVNYVANCSITYISRNRLIWLAREV